MVVLLLNEKALLRYQTVADIYFGLIFDLVSMYVANDSWKTSCCHSAPCPYLVGALVGGSFEMAVAYL